VRWACGAGLLRAQRARVPDRSRQVFCSSNSSAPGRAIPLQTLDQTGSCGFPLQAD